MARIGSIGSFMFAVIADVRGNSDGRLITYAFPVCGKMLRWLIDQLILQKKSEDRRSIECQEPILLYYSLRCGADDKHDISSSPYTGPAYRLLIES